MSLPSWLTPELILGIIGSVTGVSALLLDLMRYLKEKPKIEAEVVDATHSFFDLPDKNSRTLSFDVEVRIKNKGDKGITIGEAKTEITVGKELHVLSQKPKMISPYMPHEEDMALRVEPHDLVTTTLTFYYDASIDKLPKQEEMPFKLFLPHAHGVIKGLRGISKITQ